MANTTDALTPFRDRLGAAWLSWQTRPMLRWLALAGVGLSWFALMPLLDGRSRTGSNESILLFFLMGPFVFAALGSLQTKTQFVTPAARLVPGYRGAHLGVTALLWIALVLAAPLCLARLWHAAPLGTSAAAILVAASVAWAQHVPTLFVVPFAFVVALSYEPVRDFFFDPGLGYWPLRLGLMGIGWCAWAGWMRTVQGLHEERSDYVIPPFAAAFRRPTRAERGEQRKIFARSLQSGWLIGALTDGPLDRAIATRSEPSIPLLTRLGLSSMPSWVKGFWFAAIMGGMVIVMGEWIMFGRDVPNPTGVLMMPLIMMLFMPANMSTGMIDQKRPQMELELVRPVRRDVYFRVLLRELLRDTAVLALAMFGLVVAIAAIYTPEMLRPDLFVAALVNAIGANLLIFAAAVWLAPRCSALLRILMIMLLSYAVIGLDGALWWNREQYGVASLAVAGVAMGAVGAVVLHSAYRRWLIAEVG